MAVESRPHVYEFDPDWGRLPSGWTWGYVVGAVVDSEDRVYVHHRAAHPVVVFDKEGRVLTTWGDAFEQGAHGIHLRQEADGERIYLTDVRRHIVVKCTLDGQEIWTLGEAGRVGAPGEPFNRPTDVAFTPDGDFYVSDGYGNSRVHHFDPDRKLIRSWGEPGSGPGQFRLVHDVWFDDRGGRRRVWIADRENRRLQVFTPEGEFVKEMTGFLRPTGFYVDADGYMYVSELLGRVTILDAQDTVVAHLGGEQSLEPGKLMNPHAVWADSRGNLYVAEVEKGSRIQRFIRR